MSSKKPIIQAGCQSDNIRWQFGIVSAADNNKKVTLMEANVYHENVAIILRQSLNGHKLFMKLKIINTHTTVCSVREAGNRYDDFDVCVAALGKLFYISCYRSNALTPLLVIFPSLSLSWLWVHFTSQQTNVFRWEVRIKETLFGLSSSSACLQNMLFIFFFSCSRRLCEPSLLQLLRLIIGRVFQVLWPAYWRMGTDWELVRQLWARFKGSVRPVRRSLSRSSMDRRGKVNDVFFFFDVKELINYEHKALLRNLKRRGPPLERLNSGRVVFVIIPLKLILSG